MSRRALAWVVSMAVVAGCAAGFEPPSQINSLRILAVQKDKPYAKPGDTVTLRMLFADGAPTAPRPIHIAWFAGCTNPPGDIYAGCFTELASGAKDAGPLPTLSPSLALPDLGPVFSYTLPPSIISSRPRPTNPKEIPYGVSFVFFAACAGDHLGFLPQSGSTPTFPFACYSKTGAALGADDFVVGYTEVFAYQTLTNQNPIVTGFQVNGQPVVPECIGNDCVALEQAQLRQAEGVSADAGAPDAGGDAGDLDGGTSAGAADAGPSAPSPTPSPAQCAPGAGACVDVCTASNQGDCPQISIEMVVDPKSAEQDTAVEASGGGVAYEQMWINYYADQGKIQHDVKLLNDGSQGANGWNPDHAATLFTPQVPGPFHVWAVAHDNRGGTQWVRLEMFARGVSPQVQ